MRTPTRMGDSPTITLATLEEMRKNLVRCKSCGFKGDYIHATGARLIRLFHKIGIHNLNGIL